MEIDPVHHNPYLHDLVWKSFQHFPPGKLLDLPSGPGYFAKKAFDKGHDTVAGEIDPGLHVFNGLNYQKIDMSEKLPFDTASLDYIVSIEGIEHIENQFLFLRECSRVLKTGGRLFLTTPNVSSLENRLHFLATGFHEPPAAPIQDGGGPLFFEHINLIPFQRLETFLRFSHFYIETLETYRLKKGSLLLYPFLFFVGKIHYWRLFRKHFKNHPRSLQYKKIFKQYLSREVLLGSHLIITAKKLK